MKNLILNRSAVMAVSVCVGLYAVAAQSADYPDVKIGPTFNDKGQLVQPKDFRQWVFIGAPVTPNGLNDGHAGFPEYHNVYVEPAAFEQYRKTGTWPEGTMMVKELHLTQKGQLPDGSSVEPSGRGYFPGGGPSGLDVSVKDSKRFAKTKNWGYFNFGHHALHTPPFLRSRQRKPAQGAISIMQKRIWYTSNSISRS